MVIAEMQIYLEMSARILCEEGMRALLDMGHTGGGVLWALNDLQATIDWGYRASHVVALAGKALVRQYYGKGPERSYFVGWSVGGRQAMVEAERFPWDFDGIIAGSAPIDWLATVMTMGWHAAAARDANGKVILTAANFSAVHAAILAECDAQDGLKDGIVTDPRNCKFDPAVLLCRSISPQTAYPNPRSRR